jgi:hypothetical protein
MTYKRCKATGKKAKLEPSPLVKTGALWHYTEDGILWYFCSLADYDELCDELLREPTKLDLYLDGEESES